MNILTLPRQNWIFWRFANAADANDLAASSVLQVLDDRGRATAAIINMFDPDVIILGGRIAA